MNKLFLTLSVFAMLGLASCSDAKKEDTTAIETADKVADKAEKATEVSGNSELVSKYEALMNKSLELTKKVQSGDVSIMDEFTKLQKEITDFATNNKEAFEKMSDADRATFQKIAEKFAAAAAGVK